jgi:hypothetical protein
MLTKKDVHGMKRLALMPPKTDILSVSNMLTKTGVGGMNGLAHMPLKMVI